MKILLLIPLIAVTGCMNSSALVRAMAKDPAAVSLRITTIYGNVTLTRVGGQTNNTVMVNTEGGISVNPRP